MKFILLFFIIFNLKTYSLTQKEALEQVKGMDEREYVERSLKTILYIEDKFYKGNDSFLPVELFLNYNMNTLWEKIEERNEDYDNEEKYKKFFFEVYSKIYTEELLQQKANTYIYRKKPKDGKFMYEKEELCKKILKYSPIPSIQDCSKRGYEDSKTKTLYLKDNFAIIRLEYIKNPKYFGHFTLKKENGIWKLDGIKCGGIKECEYYQSSLR